MTRGRKWPTPRDTILSAIIQKDTGHTSPCWIWTRQLADNGYGKWYRTGFPKIVHRAAWIILRGPIPDGLHIDHLCRVRACCNPDHLEPVTPAENNRRASSFEFKTHCKRGHLLDAANVYVRPSGERNCRACRHLRPVALAGNSQVSAYPKRAAA